MSDPGDDDVHMCDTCMDMFLTREELKQHEEEKHSAKEEAKEEPRKEKRSRSSSPSDEANKKKVKMGPASRVKRDRSSSSERTSSIKESSDNGVAVSKIIDRLASTESDSGSHKSERSDRDRKDHKKHKHKDREREKDRHEERHKKKHKERDRSRDRKHGDREREKSKILEKNGFSSKVKHVDMFGERNSFDEDEAYRRAKERAKADWQIKTDLSKSKSAKPFKKSDLDDFIDDDDVPKKKYRDEPRIDDDFKKKIREEARAVEKKSSGVSGGFASQGTVKAHENDGGPECFKCGQVCKDNSNLKNHILSHYYQVFYDVLPDSKPYPCPICESTSRDRITLVRHYAFTHKKFFEMTDVTPEHLGGARIGSKGVAPPRAKPQKKAVTEDKPINRYDSDSDDNSGKKTLSNMSVEEKIKNMNSKFFRINDGSSTNQSEDDRNKDHKKHKKHKHKHKDHKEHKHHKEKKHKKEKHRDHDKERAREESSTKNPLSALMKDISPVSDTPEMPTSKDRENDVSPRYKSPDRDIHEDHVASDAGVGAGEDNAEDSDEDLLGDLDIAPVFA